MQDNDIVNGNDRWSEPEQALLQDVKLRPSDLPLDVLNADLVVGFLVVVVPLAVREINVGELRPGLCALCLPRPLNYAHELFFLRQAWGRMCLHLL